MQAEQLVARVRRRYRCTTVNEQEQPLAANLLARRFEATAPNQRWVVDTTELVTPYGKLYLAAIIDLYSRFVVGWAISALNNRHLTIKALHMALRRRCPDEGLLHHGSGQHVRERGLPARPREAWDHVQHEPARQLLRQRGDGELVQYA
jgi:putative transposase